MKCSACGAKAKEDELFRWTMQLCADRRRRRVFRLCKPCDIGLNRHVLTLMGDKNVKAKIRAYEASL